MNVCFVSTGFETVGIHFGLISSSFPLRLFKVRIYYILRGYFTGVLTHLNMFRASFPLFLESWVKIENSDLVFSRKNLFIKGVRSQNLKIKQKWEMFLMQDWPVFISNLKFFASKFLIEMKQNKAYHEPLCRRSISASFRNFSPI